MNILNSRRKNIKFEYKIGNEAKQNPTNFLDLSIWMGNRFKRERKLDTKLFQKKLNKYLFLPESSFHRYHVFKSWTTPYLERIRISDYDYHMTPKSKGIE